MGKYVVFFFLLNPALWIIFGDKVEVTVQPKIYTIILVSFCAGNCSYGVRYCIRYIDLRHRGSWARNNLSSFELTLKYGLIKI